VGDTAVPEGSLLLTEVIVRQYMQPDGTPSFEVVYEGDSTLTQVLGLLEIAKLDLTGRCTDYLDSAWRKPWWDGNGDRDG
jgi:hypothetical protein